MFCKNCGASIEANQKFCTQCGTKVENDTQNNSTEEINHYNVNPIKMEGTNNTFNNNSFSSQIETNSSYNNTNGNTNFNYNTTNVTNIPTFNAIHSIILMIFSLICCGAKVGVLFAILSIIEGNKVEYYVKNNDMENAREALRKAGNWQKATYIMIAFGIAISILLFLFNIIIRLI